MLMDQPDYITMTTLTTITILTTMTILTLTNKSIQNGDVRAVAMFLGM